QRPGAAVVVQQDTGLLAADRPDIVGGGGRDVVEDVVRPGEGEVRTIHDGPSRAVPVQGQGLVRVDDTGRVADRPHVVRGYGGVGSQGVDAVVAGAGQAVRARYGAPHGAVPALDERVYHEVGGGVLTDRPGVVGRQDRDVVE